MKHLQSRILTGAVIVVQQKESIGGQVPGVNAHFASKFVPNLFFFLLFAYLIYRIVNMGVTIKATDSPVSFQDWI